ncbi:MAG: hypothetical protein CMH38_01800 [Microbacterium sp.]|uniref:hypothetical protein n=1 Tax=Microbacterium luteum TaxID=2782167 RepID=UPI000C6B6F71|nr:hypothetical protein [Microbacterium luteum]MAY48656.1 hypothetical protein [Microbacterium sp.]HAS32997.1 hypothetical protein [Microbacterium sp.]HBR88041.1 hypothetical protein [Microbacterium sp.]HBS76184.1 hypothetical protein [Microbacterium sp.]
MEFPSGWNEEYFRAWGLPEELLEHVNVPLERLAQVAPDICLEDWTPAGSPSFDTVLGVLRRGAGVQIGSTGEPFDLAWLEPVLPWITSLHFYIQSPGAVRSLHLISRMRSLRSIRLMKTEEEVDLSDLPELRYASLTSEGQLSAVTNPMVQWLDLDLKRLPTGFRLPPMVWGMSLTTSKVDLGALGDLSNLASLGLVGVNALDLSPLRGAPALEVLSVRRARTLRGLDVLRDLKHLSMVQLLFVGEADDPGALLKIDRDLEWFEASGRAWSSEFAVEANKRDFWYVPTPKPSPVSTQPQFTTVPTDDDLIEIHFSGHELVAANLGFDAYEEVTSADIEELFTDHLQRTRATLMRDGVITFDSEADTVILTVSNSELAQAVTDELSGFVTN